MTQEIKQLDAVLLQFDNTIQKWRYGRWGTTKKK